MSNINRQVNHVDGIVLGGDEYIDGTLNAAAATYARGTLLSRNVGGEFTIFVDGGDPASAVLPYEVTSTGSTMPIRALISGRVRRFQLFEYDAGANSAPTNAMIDSLRDYSIVALEVQQLSEEDNPQP
jgi:hypothetical protein